MRTILYHWRLTICILVATASLTNAEFLFSESYSEKGAAYYYGGRTNVSIQKDHDKNRGNVLQIQFDDKAYSGVEVALRPGKCLDLSKSLNKCAIRFKVKGLTGKEKFSIGVKDSGFGGQSKIEVKCRNDYYFDVGSNWTQIELPFSAFSDQGERFYTAKQVSEYGPISWNAITSVLISTGKEQNYGCSADRIATLFFDDIEIVTDAKSVMKARVVPWRMRNDSIKGPTVSSDTTQTFFSWFNDDGLAKFTSIYTYGDPTDFSILNMTAKHLKPTFATYMNDNEWSGVTIYRGPKYSIDVSQYLSTGGIEFMVIGGKGDELFTIGLLDDESDGIDRKVQVRLDNLTYAKVTKVWQKVFIPFSDFNNMGVWWNTESHSEISGTIDWKKIAEIRFSVKKYANSKITDKGKEPVRLYFSNIKFVKSNNGVVSNSDYWKKFLSSKPDKLICNFNDSADIKRWHIDIDPTSKITLSSYVDDTARVVRMEYKIGSRGNVAYPFDTKDTLKCDWSQHSAVGFNLYSSEKGQTCSIMLCDEGNEAWCANFEAKEGWQKITVPFSQFRLFEWWQPENAKTNRIMDMNSVQLFILSPGAKGKKGTLMLDNLKLTNTKSSDNLSNCRIQTNQIGYFPAAVKRFVVTDSTEKAFSVIDKNKSVVISGNLTPFGLWKNSGEYVKTGELTEITIPGTYTLILQESGEKQQFEIGADVYKNVLNAAVKSYYYQRASLEIKPPFVGQWAHQKGILDTACKVIDVIDSNNRFVNVSGGWYDAGDYGKYVVNAGISVGMMLSLNELFPDCISDSLNIPESNNKTSDLLDEVRYELEWMKRMQDSDGGVFFKVGPLTWDAFIQPQACVSRRFVIGKSTSSSLDFAAVMAMAGRIYSKTDKQFSKDCLKRSIRAWEWSLQNPGIKEPQESGGTGAYSDSKFDDEFFWAACELFTSTKKGIYKTFIERYAMSVPPRNASNWQSVENMGWFTLATHFKNDDFKEVSTARQLICTRADENLKMMDSNPYRIPSITFPWGSNSEELNYAAVQCIAYYLTKQNKYLESIIDISDYIFGKNATNLCFVTGFGKQSPQQPHHRIMASDDIDLPFPGFLVGGPNVGREDEVSMEPGVYYPFKEPARAYVDRVGAYASNETSINWNAALVFVLGFLVNSSK